MGFGYCDPVDIAGLNESHECGKGEETDVWYLAPQRKSYLCRHMASYPTRHGSDSLWPATVEKRDFFQVGGRKSRCVRLLMRGPQAHYKREASIISWNFTNSVYSTTTPYYEKIIPF